MQKVIRETGADFSVLRAKRYRKLQMPQEAHTDIGKFAHLYLLS